MELRIESFLGHWSPQPSPQNDGVVMEDSNLDRGLCQKFVDNYLKDSPMVEFLLKAMNKGGCPMNKNTQIVCSPCSPGEGSGVFDIKTNTVLF